METTHLIEATCPDCRGPLSETVQSLPGKTMREYKCLVGHAYSARALLQAHSEAQEKVLWAAVVALEESTALIRAAAPEFSPEVNERLEKQAQHKQSQANEIRSILERLEAFQMD